MAVSLKPKPYVPTGRWWTRTKHALFTAYVNCWLRYEESKPREFYGQLDALEME